MNMVFTHTCFRVFFPPRPPKPKAYWFFAVVYPPTPLSRGVLSCELEPLLQFAESAASKACERCASDRPMGAERFWGASWRPLVTLLERLWATKGMRFWGASWRPLDALLGRLLATSDCASGAPLGGHRLLVFCGHELKTFFKKSIRLFYIFSRNLIFRHSIS